MPPANLPTLQTNSLSHGLGFQLTQRRLSDSVALTEEHREMPVCENKKNIKHPHITFAED